jgi:hypothetical protein
MVFDTIRKVTIPVLIFLVAIPIIANARLTEFTSSDYTIAAEVGDVITYRVDVLDVNYFPVITDDVLNVLKLLNTYPEPEEGYYIKNKISNINDSHIEYSRDIIKVNETATYSWGSFLESQNRSQFSITNWIMTSNQTLIAEEVQNQNIGSFYNATSNFSFINSTTINGTVVTLETDYDKGSGWLSAVGLYMTNSSSDEEYLSIVLSKSDIFSPDDPVIEEGSIRVSVNPDSFTLGVVVGNFQTLELVEYEELVPTAASASLTIGLQTTFLVTTITQDEVIMNATYLFPNGTIVEYLRAIYVEIDELYIPSFLITTNITLIDTCGVNQGFNISYTEDFVVFTQENADAQANTSSFYDFRYDRTTGFLIHNNVTKMDYNQTTTYSHILLVSTDTITSQPTTSPTTTTTSQKTTTTTIFLTSLPSIFPAFEIIPILGALFGLIILGNLSRKNE